MARQSFPELELALLSLIFAGLVSVLAAGTEQAQRVENNNNDARLNLRPRAKFRS